MQVFKERLKFLFLFFLLPTFSLAQTFRYTQYTTHEGLPIDNVYTATQDGNGFIWFSTDFGITRFDGYKFKNYDKSSGLSNTAITDIAYAGGDSLLIISYPNTIQAVHYDGHINTVATVKEITLQKLTKHNNQYYFLQRNSGSFGVLQNGKVEVYVNEKYFGEKNVLTSAIISLGNRGIAFCTNKGLFIQNGNSIKKYLPNEDVLYFTEKKDNGIIAVSGNNLLVGDLDFNFKKLPYTLPNKYRVLHMAAEDNGTIWFRGDDKGIFKLQNDKLDEVSARLGLQNKIINSYFIDSEKNTWFCTDGAGVLFKKKTTFVNYETQDALVNNKVLTLLKKNNKLYIGTSNGLSVKENDKIETVPVLNYKLGLNYVFKLFPTSNSDAGVCMSNGYPIQDSKDYKNYFTNLNYKNKNIQVFNSTVLFAWECKKNDLWFTSISNLKHTIDNKEIFSQPLGKIGIQKVYTMATYNNQTWLGAKGGLFYLKNNEFQKIDSIANHKIDLVYDLFVDSKNRFWIATENGLYVCENNIYKKINLGKTLSGNYCRSIAEDRDGDIWCATWDGVFVINKNGVINYGTAEGIVSKICNTLVYDSSKNVIYIGTDNGLSELNKKDLYENYSYNNVNISCSFEDSIQVMNNDKLKSNQSNLNFYFSLPFYSGNNALQYEYKLDDGTWNISPSPSVFLSDISTGSHKLYVRAKKNGKLFTKTDAIFSFNIAKPFYTTWWFWLAILFASQYLFFKIINHYNKKAREKKLKEQQQQAEYVSLKQQAFTSLMNPHFIFNSLNSIQHYVNRQDRQSANKYLSDFATLIRKNFDAAQQSFVSLDEELETLRLYLSLEKMRFTDKFEYKFILSTTTEDDEWMLPSMVLQPFLENSIIHGLMPLTSKGLLTIEAFTKNNALHIIITDNGVGVEKSKLYKTNKKHVSKGMQLIKERLEMLSSFSKEPILFSIEANNTNEENEGTKVSLCFPQSVYEGFQKRSLISNTMSK